VNPDDLAELEEQRAFLVRSLDDLDRELRAGDLDALDASTLRDDYTHRLADVQRAIEGGRATIATRSAPRRLGRRVVGIVIVGSMALGAGLVVANVAGSRKAGDAATGTIGNRNFDAVLSDAATKFSKGDVLGAIRDFDTVLGQDPTNLDALSGKGLVLANVAGATQDATQKAQFLAEAERLERQAIAAHADEPVPFLYLGLVLLQRSDTKGALDAFDAALARNPSAQLKTQIQQYRDQAATAK